MKKLFGLILFIFAYIASAHATTLVGNLLNPDQSGFTGTLYLSIAQQVGVSSLGTCGGPKLVVPTVVVAVPINNGAIVGTWNFYGASCTLPAGMPYNAVLKDVNGNTMFATQWLIDGATQDVGTVFQGPSPIPPTALLAVYMTSSPAGVACSGQSIAVQTSAIGGAFLFPCINGSYTAQGGSSTGPSGGMTIGGPISGASANAALFADGAGNLQQDVANYSYDKVSHILTVAQPIAGSITGLANTASSLAGSPTVCSGTNVSTGIAASGNALCRSITFSDLAPSPSFVSSAATSVVLAAGSGSKTIVLNANSGDAILVDFSFSAGLSGVSGLSVSDSHSASYSNIFSGGTPSSSAYLTTNVAGGSTTITVNYSVSGATTLSIIAADYRNVQANPLDGSSVSSGTGTSLSAGTVNTSNNNDLLVSPIFLSPQTTVGSVTGFNQDAAYVGIASGIDARLFSQLAGTAAPYNSSFSFSSSTTSNAGLIALKGSAASFPVLSVFGRTGSIAAVTGDYNFSQIAGTINAAQLPATALINPMANVGDIIVGGAAGVPTALNIGTVNTLLMSNGTTVTWGIPATLMLKTDIVSAAQFPILTGDITTPGTSLATTLKNTGTAGACGSTTSLCIPTFDAQGREISFATQAISTGVTLKTNTITNPLQTTLDMTNGPGILITNDAITGRTTITNVFAQNPTPAGVFQNVDWPPAITTAMNDEFTDAVFNTNNIWTVVNQGTDTVADKNSLLSVNAVAHSGDSFIGIYQLTPATPYAVTSKITLTGLNVAGYYGGLAFRDSATGKVVSFRIGNGSTLTVDHWNSPTSLAGTVYTQTVDSSATIYMTLKDDGTNFTFSFSRDGVNFVTAFSEGRTAFLSGPGQVGYMTGSSNATYSMTLGSDWFRRTL